MVHDKTAELVERRSRQILAAAKRVFAENGFRRTKVEDIAERLSVGKGTLYRYFKDKKSLFLAVFEQGIAELRCIISAETESISDPREKIATAVRTYFEYFDADRDLMEIMMQVRSEFKREYREFYLRTYEDYIEELKQDLRNGMKRGVFRQLDVETTADAISAMLQGALQSFYTREFGKGADHKARLTDSVEGVTSLLLRGLLKEDANETC